MNIECSPKSHPDQTKIETQKGSLRSGCDSGLENCYLFFVKLICGLYLGNKLPCGVNQLKDKLFLIHKEKWAADIWFKPKLRSTLSSK